MCPGTGPSGAGQDPNDGRTIDDVPDAASQNGYNQATVDLLRQVRGYHRKAIRAINEYIVQSKVNRNGSTHPNNQRFSTNKLMKQLMFDDDGDSTEAVQNLLSILGSLPPVTRRIVIKAILDAFPGVK